MNGKTLTDRGISYHIVVYRVRSLEAQVFIQMEIAEKWEW